MDFSFAHPILDLLLLVGPCFAFILSVPILLKLRLTDNLSKCMFALMTIMILEVINPQQGGLAVGLSGTIFYLAPVLWFWVGRQYASPVILKRFLHWCLFPLAVLAAMFGFSQTFIGFLPYQQAYIDRVGASVHSLYVGGSVRAFGFSVSGAEYAWLLAIGATAAFAAFFGRQRIWSGAVLILVPAMVLSSSRGLVLRLIVALAVIWTFRRGSELRGLALVRVVCFVVAGLVGVNLIASHYASSRGGTSHSSSASQNLLAHQASGLAHPFSRQYSSAGVHGSLLLKGIASGFVDPIGHGLGATTSAGKKLGDSGENDSAAGSSEIDFSDMFIDLGFVGGLLYLSIVFLTMRQALVFVTRADLTISLPILAVLTLSLGAWLIGGQYSTSSILFFLIGGLVNGGQVQHQTRLVSGRVPEEVFA
jgi:hypothetical protein